MTHARAFLFILTTVWSLQGLAQTVYTGASIWDGLSNDFAEGLILIVNEDGRIDYLGADAAPRGLERVNLNGKFIIPGLINVHGHVNDVWADANITDPDQRLLATLELYARYGITTVNSLGDGPELLRLRDQLSDRALHARVLAAAAVVNATDQAGAREQALQNVALGADWLKLRVDDNLGTSTKMPWEAVQGVMDVGAEHGLKVATHMFYLEDAKILLEMGSQMLAHSVRDVDIDEDLLALLRESGVCYVPTLTRELSAFVYAGRPDFFADAFFQQHAHQQQLEMVSDSGYMARMSRSPSAVGYRLALTQANRNLKIIADAGLPVAMGTDSGVQARFPGYFEHLELWMMAETGMTALQILKSATSVAADCLELDDRGTLEIGNWADFLVLDQDPLLDIEATRSLERVYIGGRQVH